MTQLANNIHAVWNVVTQSSCGITSTSYERHPEQSKIQKSKQIILDNVGLKFNIPQLPFLKDTVVKMSLKDQSRGVTDHYIYLSGEDLEVPCAAVVITEIPKNMQNLNDSLNAAVEMQKNMAQKAGVSILIFHVKIADCTNLTAKTKNVTAAKSLKRKILRENGFFVVA